jgi:hypothetical protein
MFKYYLDELRLQRVKFFSCGWGQWFQNSSVESTSEANVLTERIEGLKYESLRSFIVCLQRSWWVIRTQ